MRGDPKKAQNRTELSSKRWPLCRTPLAEIVGTHLSLLWEAAFSFSGFFLRVFQHIYPFHDGWFTSAPAHTMLSVQQFLTKTAWPSCLTFPIHPISPQATLFLFPWWKKSSKGKTSSTFCKCGRGETKNGRSTKRHQNWQVQKLFWAMEEMSQ